MPFGDAEGMRGGRAWQVGDEPPPPMLEPRDRAAERTSSPALRQLVEVVGASRRIYDSIMALCRTSYAESGRSGECALRFQLLMALRDAGFNALFFGLFAEAKRSELKRSGEGMLPAWKLAALGMAASIPPVVLTHPIEVLKTRVMTGRAANGGLLAAATAIVRAEGAAALYRGALPRLKRLGLDDTAIGDAGLVALAPALRRRPALELLDLHGNPIGDEGFKTIIQLFESTPRLQSMCGVVPGAKEVNFSNRNLKPIDIKIIAHELHSTRATAAVERVDLSNNKFDPSIIDDELKTKVDFQLDGCKP